MLMKIIKFGINFRLYFTDLLVLILPIYNLRLTTLEEYSK